MKKLIIFTGLATAILLALKASGRLDGKRANGITTGEKEMSLTGGGGVKNGLLGEEVGVREGGGSGAPGVLTV